MRSVRLRLSVGLCLGTLLGAIPSTANAKTLCVKPGGSTACYASIQLAVNAASNNDVITVAHGTYAEYVVIGKPLSLIGDGADRSFIDASGLPHGILVDGLNNPGLANVTISGLTVKNALYEGVLLLSVSDVTVRDNHIEDNDTIGPVFGSGPACSGQPVYETDESGDCGGGLHLMGTTHSIIEGNLLTGNADGVLISDETRESSGNLLTHNNVTDNPAECGIVLASHPPVGSSGPYYAPHFGVNHNTITDNLSARNGVTVGGAGVGLFSDGNGPGTVSGNVIIGNKIIGNGIPGVSLHSHVGPAFGAPADNFTGNMIIRNYIAGNGADTDDTTTPGTAGININSGGGGSPVYGTIIEGNVIEDEAIDIAVNTPAELDAHLNNLLGGKVGVADVCSVDNPTNAAVCKGSIVATENFWGCSGGPGWKGCSTTSGTDISFTPWLNQFLKDEDDH